MQGVGLFCLLRRVSKLCKVKNNHQALPAPLCLHWKNLPPPDSIFACWDIWEIQHEKIVAYARTLQFWVKKVNLPTEGKPCLLVGSVIELQEEMECYLSFSDEDVFKGIAPPRGNLYHSTRGGDLPECPVNTSQHPCKGGCHGYDCGTCCGEEAPKQVPRLGKVLHPPRPVVAARQIPPLSRGPRQRPCSQSMGEGLVQNSQTEELSMPITQSEPPSHTKELQIAP